MFRQGRARQIIDDGVAGASAEDDRIGDAIATEPIRAMDAAGVFTSDVETFNIAATVQIDLHAAHVIMRAGRNFDSRHASRSNPYSATALDHATEILQEKLIAEMRRVDQHATRSACPGRP